MLALDGVARRILLCPTDITDAQAPAIRQLGEVDIILSDEDMMERTVSAVHPFSGAMPRRETEWILFTSGTSGFPKLVQHSLESLSAPIGEAAGPHHPVWSTFYDVRRYGGLQILLRALLSGGSIVLSDAEEPVADFLRRLGGCNVSHVSGTPTHWRRALMSGAMNDFMPCYVRLSGEIADQSILDRLNKTYPRASIAHAFASTEAGVVFSVNDGRAGFDPDLLEAVATRPEIRITDGTLRVRSNCLASRYLGTDKRLATDDEGFLDTGDLVVFSEGRCYFGGRREGVVNVGGQKIYPEEIEAVINRHPEVSMSRVWGRRSPITGTLVGADVMLSASGLADDFDRIRREIIEKCRSELQPEKVPAMLKLVSEIAVQSSGKIDRRDA